MTDQPSLTRLPAASGHQAKKGGTHTTAHAAPFGSSTPRLQNGPSRCPPPGHYDVESIPLSTRRKNNPSSAFNSATPRIAPITTKVPGPGTYEGVILKLRPSPTAIVSWAAESRSSSARSHARTPTCPSTPDLNVCLVPCSNQEMAARKSIVQRSKGIQQQQVIQEKQSHAEASNLCVGGDCGSKRKGRLSIPMCSKIPMSAFASGTTRDVTYKQSPGPGDYDDQATSSFNCAESSGIAGSSPAFRRSGARFRSELCATGEDVGPGSYAVKESSGCKASPRTDNSVAFGVVANRWATSLFKAAISGGTPGPGSYRIQRHAMPNSGGGQSSADGANTANSLMTFSDVNAEVRAAGANIFHAMMTAEERHMHAARLKAIRKPTLTDAAQGTGGATDTDVVRSCQPVRTSPATEGFLTTASRFPELDLGSPGPGSYELSAKLTKAPVAHDFGASSPRWWPSDAMYDTAATLQLNSRDNSSFCIAGLREAVSR